MNTYMHRKGLNPRHNAPEDEMLVIEKSKPGKRLIRPAPFQYHLKKKDKTSYTNNKINVGLFVYSTP